MIKFLIFIIIGYLVFKFFRSMLMPKTEDEKVRGKKTEQTNKRNIDDNKIEDADFEELE